MSQNYCTTKQTGPLFSVVIPVHNKAPHIGRCIRSVLEQTCKDFEILLVDDASTDDSIAEAQRFTDSRIRLMRRDTPGPGGYAARNLGVKNARGQWIAFLDADDQWQPLHLEKMKKLAQQYPNVFFMSCGWEKKKEGGINTNLYFQRFHRYGNHQLNLKEYLQAGVDNMLPVWTSVACIKKKSPLTTNLFPAETTAKRGGDIHTWLRIMCYHKKMAWSCHAGAIYHTDSQNMVTKSAKTGSTLLQPKIFRQLAQNLHKEEITLLRKYFNTRLKKSLITSIKNKQKKYNYRNCIQWKGDFLNASKLLLWSLIPLFLWHFVYFPIHSKKDIS